MIKSFKSLLVIVALIAMASSCKKATDLSNLTSHKWTISTAAETYSDSAGISHNLLGVDTPCQHSSYTEYHTQAANSPLKLAYSYGSTNCPAYYMPSLGISSWDIDPDQTVLYLNGNTTDGTGGTWYTIQTLSASSMVLTQVASTIAAYTGTYPNRVPVYHVVTDTWTYSVK